MKILIIEDEQPNFLRLKKLLGQLDRSWIIEGPLISQTAVKDYFAGGNTPDLIISDIRLSDGLVFDALDEVDCRARIIFTTAYSEYAIRAFQYNSIQYLLKPIVKEELAAAISKVASYHPERLSEIPCMTRETAAGSSRKRFLVQRRDGFEIVKVEDVAFLKHDCGSLWLHGFNGEHAPLDITIDECETQLATDMFFRANRQFIVNINSIGKLVSYWDRKLKIVLTGFPDVEVMVSREKARLLREWIDR